MPTAALALRTTLVLLTSLSLHITCTPPHPSPPPAAQYAPQDRRERAFVAAAGAVKHPTWLAQVLLWAAAASELWLAFTHPEVRAQLGAGADAKTTTMPGALAARARMLGVDAQMLAGCAAAVLGGWTRARCYRLLGRRFTFELATHAGEARGRRGGAALGADGEQSKTRHPASSATDEEEDRMNDGARNDHVGDAQDDDQHDGEGGRSQLVTTSPYALVRHPSYSGACLAFYGALAVFLAPRSATRLAGGPGTPILALLTFLALAPLYTLPRRIAREERMLASEFGQTWARYARRVQWRMVPGVY